MTSFALFLLTDVVLSRPLDRLTSSLTSWSPRTAVKQHISPATVYLIDARCMIPLDTHLGPLSPQTSPRRPCACFGFPRPCTPPLSGRSDRPEHWALSSAALKQQSRAEPSQACYSATTTQERLVSHYHTKLLPGSSNPTALRGRTAPTRQSLLLQLSFPVKP